VNGPFEESAVTIDPASLDTIFCAAVDMAEAEERAAYIARACGDDHELRGRVEKLVAAHFRAGSFLQEPSLAWVPTVDEPPVSEAPGTIIGPYKLLQQIGEGGMGTVFMAEQTQPVQRKVALKLIKAGMDSRQVIARFEAERQALAMMDHVNIARVFDGGTTAPIADCRLQIAALKSETSNLQSAISPGRPYFVMELVHGVPITKYCDDNHLTPRQRLELFVPVCQAIQHAHQKGIIHRDIKPSNVMVTLYDGKPVPKVIDFGVAKATEQKLTERTLFTQYGTMVGTLEYMSPEQAEMSALGVDTRSDIYSLGVLLYELLTGSTPLTHKRIKEAAYAEILRLIKEEEPPRPSTRLSDSGEALASISAQRHMEPAKLAKLVRGELDWIVMKTLEKDRNRRYETANAFAADVQRYLSDEPVQACPPSAGYRLRKLARRNKTAFATTAVLVIAFLLVAGTLGWSVRNRSAREQEVASNQAAREAALDDQVRQTLDEAETVLAQGKWSQATATVERADKLLAAAGRPELPPRLLALQKDLAFAQRLEDIYSNPKTEEFVWGLEPDAAYARAFADAGMDVTALSVVEAAERIRARSIRRELARALDFWSYMRQRAGNARPPDWKRLVEIAEAADPDPWRNRLRQARRGGDRKALETLAASANFAQLPAETVLLLANALYESGGKEQATALLRQACLHHPDDWYLSNWLGWWCQSAQPPRYDEAIRYYTACMVARPRNAYVLHGIAEGLTGKKAFAEAIAVLSRAIELKGDFWDARVRRAEAYLKLGEVDKAFADYSKAIELDPKNHRAWCSRSGVYIELGQFKKGLKDASEAIHLDPRCPYSWSCRGIAYAHLGEKDKAIADCSKAIELGPNNATAWSNRGMAYQELHQYDKALADLNKAIELGPNNATAWNNRGMAYQKLHQYDKALADLNKAIELDPNNASAWSNRGVAYQKLHQYDKALADLNKAIELDPKSLAAWNNRGSVYLELHQYDKALADLNKAIGLDPNNATAWSNRAAAYARLGQADKAIADCSKAVELDPKDVSAWNNRGATYNMAKRYDKALGDLNKAIELGPKETAAWSHRGQSYLALGQLDKAIADCTKAIELVPKDVSAWNNRGAAYRRLHEYDKAVADFNKVIELDPKSPAAWNNRGSVYLELHQYDKAVADYSKAIELDPKIAQVWGGRAAAYYKLHQYDKAVADYSKAIELGPENVAAHDNLVMLLAMCPDAKVRDPGRALQVARQGVARAPGNASLWRALGWALYRTGAWKDSIEAFRKSMALQKSPKMGYSWQWFGLAVAHWQLGNKEEARKWHDQAVQWMEKHRPRNEHLRAIRAEAEATLKIEKKALPK
jgi:tetratricopeptide (TPR) repeat protein/serine/threonine protein kinase